MATTLPRFHDVGSYLRDVVLLEARSTLPFGSRAHLRPMSQGPGGGDRQPSQDTPQLKLIEFQTPVRVVTPVLLDDRPSQIAGKHIGSSIPRPMM